MAGMCKMCIKFNPVRGWKFQTANFGVEVRASKSKHSLPRKYMLSMYRKVLLNGQMLDFVLWTWRISCKAWSQKKHINYWNFPSSCATNIGNSHPWPISTISHFLFTPWTWTTSSPPDRPGAASADSAAGRPPLPTAGRRHRPRLPPGQPAGVGRRPLGADQPGPPPADQPGTAAFYHHPRAGHDGRSDRSGRHR